MRYKLWVLSAMLVCLASGLASAQTEGLFGEYFGTVNMTNLRLTRIDPQVYFEWDTGSPHPNMPVDSFSVCWTGFVTPTQGGAYTFYVTADDGVRLWVNDVMLVNQWRNQAPTEYSAVVTLSAGQPHPIRIDYYENAGGATIKLEWEGPDVERQPVGAAHLTPGSGLGDRLRDWHRNPANGHYYRIIGPPMTWAAGRAKAAALGGYLTTINDAAENAWLVGMFRPVTDVAFIGANDIAEEGVWVWDQTGETFWNGAADGTAVPGFYTNWLTGEPNDHGDGEDVATIQLGSGLWNDLNAARERYCIVEAESARINYDGPAPAAKMVEVGSRFEVAVNTWGTAGTVRYQWYKDGEEILGADSATLVILHVSPAHAGRYACKISDDTPATVMTSSATLMVVDQMPAVSLPGLAALGALLALAAARCKRRK